MFGEEVEFLFKVRQRTAEFGGEMLEAPGVGDGLLVSGEAERR